MFRISIFLIAIFWGCLIFMIGTSLFIATILPSRGTILITHNLFLNRQDRFELYDISRQLMYSFSPDDEEGVLFISLAPTGRKMAILQIEDNQPQLSITNYRGITLVDPIVTYNTIEFDEVSWSPDGRYFTYYVQFLSRRSSIFIVDTLSGEWHEIQHDWRLIASPSWSADSQQIAYTDSSDEFNIAQIWIADANGNYRQQLTYTAGGSYCPAWSPDGETIAFVELELSGEKLSFINLDGLLVHDYPTGIWRMTTCPRWSNDGRSIIFIGLDEEHLRTSIILYDLQTGNEQSLFEVEQTASLQIWR